MSPMLAHGISGEIFYVAPVALLAAASILGLIFAGLAKECSIGTGVWRTSAGCLFRILSQLPALSMSWLLVMALGAAVDSSNRSSSTPLYTQSGYLWLLVELVAGLGAAVALCRWFWRFPTPADSRIGHPVERSELNVGR